MHQGEWAALVGRLNLNWPGQQITKATADDWFPKLEGFPAAEVRDALERHRCNITPGRDGLPIGRWMPALADLLACIDANWQDAAAERRQLEAQVRRTERNSRGGVTAPAETTEARRILEASKTLPDEPGHMVGAVARQRIEAIADQLEERTDREHLGQLT